MRIKANKIFLVIDSEIYQPNSLLPKTCGIQGIPREKFSILPKPRGHVAKIGEFPWAVLLDYLTRK